MTTLYIKDNAGAIRTWTISIDYLAQELVIDYGVLGGAIQTKTEYVPEGKVNRTVDEQLELQANARIKKQLDRGYSTNMADAETRPTNTLGMPKPMLAKTFGDVKIPKGDMWMQRKYDGNRCMIANRGGDLIAYSRNGIAIKSIHHILDDLNIPEGMILDGELYCHGQSLQTIVSWIKREQDATKLLKYVVYDTVSELPFSNRYAMISNIEHHAVNVAPSWYVEHSDDIHTRFREFRSEGYEGAIIRVGDAGYEDGKRSSSLLKLKEWKDEEFYVLDVIASKDGWGILVCKNPRGGTFNVSAPGDMYAKTHILKNKDLYIGRFVTVEYANLTKDGVPFHPTAKAWR
jgi:DNA ligase-1